MNFLRSTRIAWLLIAMIVISADAQVPSDASPSKIVEWFISAYNDHDIPEVLALVDPDVQWLSVVGDSVSVQTSGADALAESLLGYFESIPSSRSTVESMMEAGRFVTVWERAHWERDGVSRSQSSLAVYEINEGVITRIWYYPTMK